MPNPIRFRRIIRDKPVGKYIVNDTFTTARAAGTVNNTLAEPGPGRRGVADAGSYLSLSSGFLNLSGGGLTDSVLTYDAGLERRVGIILKWRINSYNNTFVAGWAPDTVQVGASEYIFPTTTTVNIKAATNLVVSNSPPTPPVVYAMISRASGSFHFQNNLLLYISNTLSIPLYIRVYGTSTGDILDYIRVPSERWLPAPLISDGFGSTFGTADGEGHAEGVTGGIGAGGAGGAWTNSLGTWTASSGTVAATTLSGGIGIATINSSKSDVYVSAKLTVAGGTNGIIVRYVDNDNFIRLVHNGTNVQLVKRVATVETTLVNVAATYVPGAKIILRVVGQQYRCYYNDTLIGTEQTISDATFDGKTVVGLRSTNTGNTVDDFVAYAVGTGGEHGTLDLF